MYPIYKIYITHLHKYLVPYVYDTDNRLAQFSTKHLSSRLSASLHRHTTGSICHPAYRRPNFLVLHCRFGAHSI